MSDHDQNEYMVFCYDPSQDKWTTLPPLPVKRFGLGQVNGELVAVGGRKKSSWTTDKVYGYCEKSQKWKQTIPPMPTARDTLDLLVLQSALVAVGGCILSSSLCYESTTAIEIFKPDTSQWYRTDPLPLACADVSLVAIGNTCYALGGPYRSKLTQALYASVDDLLGNAVPANRTTHSGSHKSAWNSLPSTPTFGPAAAVLDGNLLAIGGEETSILREAAKREIYTYSPSTNSWIYISGLPAPRSGTAVAVLSSTEILVIGGRSSDRTKVNTVYKGTLHLKP